MSMQMYINAHCSAAAYDSSYDSRDFFGGGEDYDDSPDPVTTPMLANLSEFQDGISSLGYERGLGTRIFYLLGRSYGSEYSGYDPDRSAESIMYREVNREGEKESVVSLPNLAARLSEVSEVPMFGKLMMEATTQLVTPYVKTQ
ncbi:MAG: hypothetical protein ACHQT9_00035 [Candidatus Saccharimonadales bacterium]